MINLVIFNWIIVFWILKVLLGSLNVFLRQFYQSTVKVTSNSLLIHANYASCLFMTKIPIYDQTAEKPHQLALQIPSI